LKIEKNLEKPLNLDQSPKLKAKKIEHRAISQMQQKHPFRNEMEDYAVVRHSLEAMPSKLALKDGDLDDSNKVLAYSSVSTPTKNLTAR
jgi:hypothetical protein